MSITMQKHLRESVFKTALIHFLRNGKKSPERTARNIEELVIRFNPSPEQCRLHYDELLSLIQSAPPEECIRRIMDMIS